MKINSEVFLVRNKSHASIEMNINKNVTLEKERKSLSIPNAKIKNIIMIYFDTLSRAHFHRRFSDFSSFISDLDDLTNNNYASFEFMKYHTFGTEGFNPTLLSMFFGKNSFTHKNQKKKDTILWLKSPHSSNVPCRLTSFESVICNV